MIKEFKEFAFKGNVVDLAVGVIIGAAFGRVVSSLVNDVLTPPLGKLTSNVDFKDLYIDLSGKHYPTLAAAKAAGAPTINYGLFLNAFVDFVIVAFVVFLVITYLQRLLHRQPAPAPKPSGEEKLLQEIRDLLKQNSHVTSAASSS